MWKDAFGILLASFQLVHPLFKSDTTEYTHRGDTFYIWSFFQFSTEKSSDAKVSDWCSYLTLRVNPIVISQTAFKTLYHYVRFCELHNATQRPLLIYCPSLLFFCNSPDAVSYNSQSRDHEVQLGLSTVMHTMKSSPSISHEEVGFNGYLSLFNVRGRISVGPHKFKIWP